MENDWYHYCNHYYWTAAFGYAGCYSIRGYKVNTETYEEYVEEFVGD